MDELLYHYSTGAGLLGMLKDYTKDEPYIKMWASHYMYMNDPQEYEIGKKICAEIIDKFETKANIPANLHLKAQVESPEYCEALENFSSTLDGQSICPYLISFSRANDSLHMWDMYACNGNGLAIGFNRSKLSKSKIYLKDCHYYYEEDNTELINKLTSDIKELYDEYDKQYPLNLDQYPVNKEDLRLFYKRIHIIYTLICGHIGISIKAGAYKIEEEVRITLHSQDSTNIRFRDRKGIIIPYFEYPIPFDCVENIIVGPTADFNRIRRAILIYLNSKGIEWDTDKIIKSKVPYRL